MPVGQSIRCVSKALAFWHIDRQAALRGFLLAPASPPISTVIQALVNDQTLTMLAKLPSAAGLHNLGANSRWNLAQATTQQLRPRMGRLPGSRPQRRSSPAIRLGTQ